MKSYITVSFLENSEIKVKKFEKFDLIPSALFDTVFSVECSNMKLKSIPFFPNLVNLTCSNNKITEILQYPKLKILVCDYNQINKIPDLPYLTILDCSFNPINELSHYPILENLSFNHTEISSINPDNISNVEYLRCCYSKMINIPSLYNLKLLMCNGCELTIFTGNFPELTTLSCSYNMINGFSAEMPKIKNINCTYNTLTDLPVYDSLIELLCCNNNIKIIKSYPNLKSLSITNNKLTEFSGFFPNLKNLYCNNNRINLFTAEIPNIDVLFCQNNQITELPNYSNITHLNFSNNQIRELCLYQEIRHLTCDNNQISEIPEYRNIEYLSCKNNQIREIPNLMMLNCLYCDGNLLNTLPNINTWPNLLAISFEGNQIDYLPIHIQATIDRLLNVNRNNLNIYNDSQNIHDTGIQKSIQKSIDLIIRDRPTIDFPKVICEINYESDLSNEAKTIIKKSCDETETFSVCGIRYRELFVNVWSIIREHSERKEIIKVLNQEMVDSIDKCFVGKISRLINCLNGFDPRVVIEIDIKEQITNVIALIQMKLENNNEYTVEKHHELAIEALRERNIDEETIKLWISYIE